MKKCIHITAGRGPEECCYAVAQVLKKMIEHIERARGNYQVVHREPGSINGNVRSASLWVDTGKAPDLLDEWIGTIQWISQSPFRPQHKRKNWFVRVFELEQKEQAVFDPRAVRFESFRSGGKGGQHVNKVETAVRATYPASGVSVKVSDSRSQAQNRKLALERLEALWNAQVLEQLARQHNARWGQHAQLERGNPVKTFVSEALEAKKSTKFRDERSRTKQDWKNEME